MLQNKTLKSCGRALLLLTMISILLCVCLPYMTELITGEFLKLNFLFVAMFVTSILFLIRSSVSPASIAVRNIDRRDRLLDYFSSGILHPKIYPLN